MASMFLIAEGQIQDVLEPYRQRENGGFQVLLTETITINRFVSEAK